MNNRPQLLQVLLWCIFAFHVIIVGHAFSLFGFHFSLQDLSSYHPYTCLLYTLLWFLVCIETHKYIGIAYVIITASQFFIKNFTENDSIKNAFGTTLFPLDAIFSLIIFVDIFSTLQNSKPLEPNK